jgi:hypothetical protein
VTLIQHFGSALNLNIHFHMIFLDGVYLPVEGASPVFRHVPAPTMTFRPEYAGAGTEREGAANAARAHQSAGGSVPLEERLAHSRGAEQLLAPR